LGLAGTLALAIPGTVHPQTPEERFWGWFKAHDAELFTARTANEAIASELHRELQRIHPDLTFEFGPVEEKAREFVISADGLLGAFPAVIALGRAAPALAHWRVIMFRPPRLDVTQVRIGAVELDAKAVEFLAEPDGQLVGLSVSIPGYRETPENEYELAAYLLLDGMLGEYTVEKGVSFIEFMSPAQRRRGQWRPLTRVQEAVPVLSPD
jgi:hypothetical protein